MKLNFIAATFMLATVSALAQTNSDLDRPLTLAPADGSAAASAGSDDAKAAEAELVKKSLNPVASLVSVPIQNNWDFGIGPANAMRYTANLQPVIPFSLNDDWNLITRTILPVIYLEPTSKDLLAPASARESHYGLGDTTQSFYFSPKQPVDGWILGAGPVGYYPTATDNYLGSGEWGAGPTTVVLQQKNGFTYGFLANQIWSFAGQKNRPEINSTYIQPFLNYSTKTFTTFGVNTESTYNWEADQWTVPLNFTISQMLKIGKQPIQFQVGYRYYAERPADGPDWGLRFTITFLFPK